MLRSAVSRQAWGFTLTPIITPIIPIIWTPIIWNSRQHKLPDSTAVAENRIAGGVGEVTGAIPSPRPDRC
jgi:hypothetical protein